MRIALAVLMVVHGFAHLVGFVTSWRLAALENMTYKTTVLAGHLDIGDVGIRVVGILWLLIAVAFGVAATGALTHSSWWVPTAMSLAVASLFLCLLGWPDSSLGIPVNLMIIVALILGLRLGWL